MQVFNDAYNIMVTSCCHMISCDIMLSAKQRGKDESVNIYLVSICKRVTITQVTISGEHVPQQWIRLSEK